MEEHKRAVIYIRVSDPSQIDNNSLEVQEKLCKQYIESRGWELVKVFREEGESAKTIKSRPQLMALTSFCAVKSNKISFLVVYKIDRLSRNMLAGLEFITYLTRFGVLIASATEQFGSDAAGTFLKNIMMASAQYDNENKGERVRDNMQQVFRDGLWPFKCPIGYMRPFRTKEENKGHPPIPHPGLSPIIAQMFADASTGIYNKSQLARMMNLRGFGDHYKVEANHKIVQEILSKSFYYGDMYAQKWDEHALGRHLPITDELTWKKAYHRLVLKKKNYQYHDETLYPLKGFLKCEFCNHPLTTSPSQGNGGLITYYECRNKGCKKVRISAEKAHQQFQGLLTYVQANDRVVKLFQHMVFEEWQKVIDQARKEAEKIDQRITSFKQELKSIRQAKDDGLYCLAQAKEEAEKIQGHISLLEIERSDIKIEELDTTMAKGFTEQFLKNLSILWDNLDLPKRQALLHKVFCGTLIATGDKKIRTSKLSPSFELIDALNAEKGEKVTPWGIEPQLAG